MKIIDKAESIEWLSSRGLADSEGRLLTSGFARKATFHINHDSGVKTAMARALARHYAEFEESILWVDEFGIWPSSENRHLFDGFRRSLGESRPLWERPGHIFSPSDADAVFSLLCLVLYFIWGAVLAPSSGDLVVRISHDEMIDVYARRDDRADDEVFDFLKEDSGSSPQ